MASSSGVHASASAPRRMPFYDFLVGENGVTEFDFLTRLVSTTGFEFKPGGKKEEQTVKVTDYFFLDANDELCSFEKIKKEDFPVYLHGKVHTWVAGGFVGTFNIGNVKVTKWTFQENETGDAFNIFVRGGEMHYFLNKPADFYEAFLETTTKKMDILHWICNEIVNGQFAIGNNVEAGAIEAFVNAHDREIGLITEHWGFVKKLVYEHLEEDYPDLDNCALWEFIKDWNDYAVGADYESDE